MLPWRLSVALFVGMTCLAIALSPESGQSEICIISPYHAGLTFPVERVDPNWTCRLQAIIDNYTTTSTVGPIRAALSKSMYWYLLDHPPFAAALINRLDLGLYRSEARGPGRFWGTDGKGTEGIVELVYQDAASRIYYLEGAHSSLLLPHITGKAVVFLRMRSVNDTTQIEAMESTIAAYTKLDNRIFSGLVSLLHPLIGGVVRGKLRKGMEAVNLLGETMRQQPDRVLRKAMDQPALLNDDLGFFKEALARKPISDTENYRNALTP